ncbi:LLGL scribble cell polarity complex component 2-like [Tubulanus polymorphus]|uniref:LLGL scribble cell polarity complex component 2-like n=1 Tax=Tubulanus polymorphus TaxID=672921 RepID=UPI003DA3A01E
MSAIFKQFRRMKPKDSSRKTKLAQDLLQFQKCTDHGFPHKPSALAYDPSLNLLAIATKTGVIKIFGKPGVEFDNVLESGETVGQLIFLPEQGRLLSVCRDNTVHLWEINGSDLDHVRTFTMEEGRLMELTVACLTADGKTLLLGTESGNIHQLDLENFTLKADAVIYQDVVMQNVPDEFKLNPGSVEAIEINPCTPDKVLIGYNKGLCVLWDMTHSRVQGQFASSQQLESFSWNRDGTQFITSHNDGSYINWPTTIEREPVKPSERTAIPYGPFPCKPITKILTKPSTSKEPFIIFSGGMPRASYDDRHTVTVMEDTQHVVFEVTSPVIDFVTMDNEENGSPHTLIILAEEEIVFIDLVTKDWPTFRLPYLASMHSSAITCAQHISHVPEDLWNKIKEIGLGQDSGHSTLDWPLTGGINAVEDRDKDARDLLLTGHEDGTIQFWDASTPAASLLYKLSTSTIFTDDVAADSANDGEEEWPPFRKVSTYDPFSDDPRLAIQRIELCPLSETLVVGGSAGQVVMMNIEGEETTKEVATVQSNIVSDRDSFVWKGHQALEARSGEIKFAAGFQPTVVLQVFPPAATTALTFQPEWQILVAGTAHGFTVFDYAQKKEVLTNCTLNPEEHVQESSMSRGKKFKKSLRESIRRLRVRKRHGGATITTKKEAGSPKKSPSKSPSKEDATKEETKEEKEEEKKESPTEEEKPAETSEEPVKEVEKKESEEEPAAAAAESESATASPTEDKKEEAEAAAAAEVKPEERKIEARAADDSMNSVVRLFHFAETFILEPSTHHPSLWVGTNGGFVFVYKLVIPEGEKRASETVQCDLCKEIKLRHRAPVIAISVLDKQGHILPKSIEITKGIAKEADMSGGHSLLICSEEQMKIFSLPNLKAKTKQKITALDGSRVRKIGVVNICSRNDEEYISYGISTLSNLGEVSLYTIPHLSLQSKNSCIKKENLIGISSCVFDQYGQGFYLSSPSEFTRFALTTYRAVKPDCSVELKEGMRPPKPEPVEETPATNEEDKTDGAAEGTSGEQKTDDVEQVTEGLEKSTLDDSKAEDTPATDITIDSVKEYMTSSSEAHTSVVVERTTVQSTRTISSESTEKQLDGTITVSSTTTTTTEEIKDGDTDIKTNTTSETYVVTDDDPADLKKQLEAKLNDIEEQADADGRMNQTTAYQMKYQLNVE